MTPYAVPPVCPPALPGGTPTATSSLRQAGNGRASQEQSASPRELHGLRAGQERGDGVNVSTHGPNGQSAQKRSVGASGAIVEPTEPLFAYCAAGHGWSEVRDYDGLLLCVRYCWPRKERVAAQIRGIVARKEAGLSRKRNAAARIRSGL